MSLTLRVIDRKKNEKGIFSFDPASSTVQDLKNFFAQKYPKYYPDRQYFTIGTDKNRIVLTPPEKKLSEFPLVNNSEIVFKDLGPQISWKTVFHVEYFGPILIHSLFFFLPNLFYEGPQKPKSLTQTVAYWLVVLHYVKRELETHYVHRFSNATMPFFNIFKNSTHYWILGGASIAYFLYHPNFTPAFNDQQVYIAAFLFILMELGNLHAHIVLRNLRPPGTRVRAVPRGGLFEFVTCANYSYELGAWLIFSIFTQTLTAYLFFFVSFAQITEWSLKKHSLMKKEFPNAPRRKALIPFIL